MKDKKYLFTGLAFGIALGWALGFLRIPYIEKDFSFLVGFLAALACVSLALILAAAWNRIFLSALTDKKPVYGNSQSKHTYTFFRIILAGFLVSGGLASGYAVYRRIESFKLQIQKQDGQLREMTALMERVRKQDMAPLMRAVLDDVAEEIKHNPGRTLRDTTIARIAALSFNSKPYRYVEGDSLSEKAYSPERGQLLRALALLRIDSGAFNRIKERALFAGADLRGADLKGLDLGGINLHEANLKDADLSGANLSGADLGSASLWGANLNRANLSRADLRRANMTWAQLNNATLTQTNLNGANLSNAQLRKAEIYDANVQWAQSEGALFNEANLTSVNFQGANLTKANLSQANLVDADLRRINLSEADVQGVRCDKALVDKNWSETLKKWQPGGMTELQEGYGVVNDTFDKWKIPMFRLKKLD